MNVTNKIVVVTGGSRGLGLGVVEARRSGGATSLDPLFSLAIRAGLPGVRIQFAPQRHEAEPTE